MLKSSKESNKQEISRNRNKFKINDQNKRNEDHKLSKKSSVIIYDTNEFTYSIREN